ncbi:hypothetical protein IWZ00DRAFT_334611 [Phyllosticta capitalensis]
MKQMDRQEETRRSGKNRAIERGQGLRFRCAALGRSIARSVAHFIASKGNVRKQGAFKRLLGAFDVWNSSSPLRGVAGSSRSYYYVVCHDLLLPNQPARTGTHPRVQHRSRVALPCSVGPVLSCPLPYRAPVRPPTTYSLPSRPAAAPPSSECRIRTEPNRPKAAGILVGYMCAREDGPDVEVQGEGRMCTRTDRPTDQLGN